MTFKEIRIIIVAWHLSKSLICRASMSAQSMPLGKLGNISPGDIGCSARKKNNNVFSYRWPQLQAQGWPHEVHLTAPWKSIHFPKFTPLTSELRAEIQGARLHSSCIYPDFPPNKTNKTQCVLSPAPNYKGVTRIKLSGHVAMYASSHLAQSTITTSKNC